MVNNPLSQSLYQYQIDGGGVEVSVDYSTTTGSVIVVRLRLIGGSSFWVVVGLLLRGFNRQRRWFVREW